MEIVLSGRRRKKGRAEKPPGPPTRSALRWASPTCPPDLTYLTYLTYPTY